MQAVEDHQSFQAWGSEVKKMCDMFVPLSVIRILKACFRGSTGLSHRELDLFKFFFSECG